MVFILAAAAVGAVIYFAVKHIKAKKKNKPTRAEIKQQAIRKDENDAFMSVFLDFVFKKYFEDDGKIILAKRKDQYLISFRIQEINQFLYDWFSVLELKTNKQISDRGYEMFMQDQKEKFSGGRPITPIPKPVQNPSPIENTEQPKQISEPKEISDLEDMWDSEEFWGSEEL